MLTPDGQMYDDSGECQCSYCRGIRIRISHRAREARKMKLNEEIRQAEEKLRELYQKVEIPRNSARILTIQSIL